MIDNPDMYDDKPYMYEDNPYMYDDIAYMYDDIAYINDDMTYMYEYHIYVWYHVIGGDHKNNTVLYDWMTMKTHLTRYRFFFVNIFFC